MKGKVRYQKIRLVKNMLNLSTPNDTPKKDKCHQSQFNRRIFAVRTIQC